MKDRIPTKILANGAIRYGVYDDAGNFLRYEYIKLEDEPTEKGDPLGKATLLPDDVATALGLTGNPQVKDALSRLSGAVNPLQYVWDKQTPTFPVNPTADSRFVLNGNDTGKIHVVTYGDSISYDGARITIDNPTTINISYSNASSFSTVLQGKYWFSDYGPTLYKGTSADSLTENSYSGNYYVQMNSYDVSVEFSFVQQVSAWESNAYPSNGFVDGYKYIARAHPQPIDARIATGSYISTGTFGSTNKNSLTFDFVPKLVIIKSRNTISLSPYITSVGFFMQGTTRGIVVFAATNGSAYPSEVAYPTWSEKTLSWYAGNANAQLNSVYTNGGVNYFCVFDYVAIG